MELVDVVDSKSTASDGVPVRVRPPAPARRELRKFATTFYALHKKSSLTCSTAPRFKTVTASLGYSFVPPTWKLIHSVHMTQLRNAPFGTSPRLAARSLSRTGRFFASASRPRCWVVMQGYEVRTCSAAPRFKTVTASLGHGFVPPTWKLIRSVHMIHEKRAFVLRDKSSFFVYHVNTSDQFPSWWHKTVTQRSGHSFEARSSGASER